MIKLIGKVLVFIATIIIVALPIYNSFFGPKPHHIHHLPAHNGHSCDLHHLYNGSHDYSWNLIKNTQLSTPPASVSVKTPSFIFILFAICFVSLAFAMTKVMRDYTIAKVRLSSSTQRYNIHSILLI
ncbi:MAG TPA: hypothetical protein VHA56_04340 [Mucilaginibacter sp.]|nr:hypothetical protein [Mucilaginibacter sp.]